MFHFDAWVRTNDEGVAEPTSQDSVLHYLHAPSFDVTDVASAIAAAALSLQYCFITTSTWARDAKSRAHRGAGKCWRKSWAWRISGTSSGGEADNRKLVDLHDDVAETIIRNESLTQIGRAHV